MLDLPRNSCQLMLPQKIAKQKPYPQHSCISLFHLVRLFLSKKEMEKKKSLWFFLEKNGSRRGPFLLPRCWQDCQAA
jgi:hypothetical protein